MSGSMSGLCPTAAADVCDLYPTAAAADVCGLYPVTTAATIVVA